MIDRSQGAQSRMITLEPMSLEDYTLWKQRVIEDYADSEVRVGNAGVEDASTQSELEFYKLFPYGLNTDDCHFYRVVDEESKQDVGMLCFKIRRLENDVFLCDIRMNAEHRGKGYGKQTLAVLEELAKEMGISKISLHVFGDNEVALKLYRLFGFTATNVMMSKVVEN